MPPAPPSQEQTRVACPRCGATNHLPSHRVDGRTACGDCGRPLFPGETLVLEEAMFDRQVRPSDLPVVVVFWAVWSAAARSLAREARDAAAHLEPQCRVALVDGEGEQPLISSLGVRALPCVVLYRSGEELVRHEGPLPEGTLVEWAREALQAAS